MAFNPLMLVLAKDLPLLVKSFGHKHSWEGDGVVLERSVMTGRYLGVMEVTEGCIWL